MDGLDKLSAATGLKRDDLQGMAEKAKRNGEALRACAGHAFVNITPEKTFGARYRCTVCSGEIDSHAHYWYTVGRAQAGAA